MQVLCAAGIGIVLFFVLLGMARKKPPLKSAAAKKDYTPVYLTLADKPLSIMNGMDKLVRDIQNTETAGDRWRRIPLVIFSAGFALVAVDGILYLLGYNSFIFSIGGVLVWAAALVMALSLRRSRSQAFSLRYKGTKEILHTLRDDLKPGSTFLGHVDLTGSLLPTKVARASKDSQDRTTEFFRDEWLALKAKLFDGNVIRVSAIQKSKKRKSYWKRSRVSGKMKMKPEKFKGSEHDLKVRIVVNPEAYKLTPASATFKQGLNIGKFTISQLSTEGGMINFVANSPFDEVEHENILNVLQSAYSLLQRKAA